MSVVVSQIDIAPVISVEAYHATTIYDPPHAPELLKTFQENEMIIHVPSEIDHVLIIQVFVLTVFIDHEPILQELTTIQVLVTHVLVAHELIRIVQLCVSHVLVSSTPEVDRVHKKDVVPEELDHVKVIQFWVVNMPLEVRIESVIPVFVIHELVVIIHVFVIQELVIHVLLVVHVFVAGNIRLATGTSAQLSYSASYPSTT